MRIFLFVMACALCWPGCRNCDCASVSLPQGLKPPPGKQGGTLHLKITAANKVFLDTTEIPVPFLDSILESAIHKKKESPLDTIRVVVSADSASAYGIFFDIARIAKKQAAKVITNIEK